MKLGFVSAILPEDSLEQVLSTASQIGYDCVELACWPPGKATRRYAGVTHIDATQNDESSVVQLAQLIRDSGISISGLGYYPNVLSPDPDEAKTAVTHLRRLIEMSAQMEINQVNSFAGRDPSKTIDANWQAFLDCWGPLIEFADQHNVRVGIENCPMFFTDDEWPGGKNLAISPAVWRRMFDAIPSPNFGLNYDPSHLIWMQMDAIAPIAKFADRIFHVHAKDVRVHQGLLNEHGILANPNLYHSPKLPGLGEVDWANFFSTLGDISYQGPVCVEVEDRSYEGSRESCVLALKQSHTFLRNFIPK